MDQSSVTFFYKIHSGTVSLDKYLNPAPNLRRTRASHESQYIRYLAYSDALKNSNKTKKRAKKKSAHVRQ